MNYIDFNVGANEYKLRLTTRSIISLEKKLGANPLTIFTDLKGKTDMPSMEKMMLVFHASLQAFHKDISLDSAYDIFDEWLNEGHFTAEFLMIIVEIYKASGLIQKDKDEKN